MAMQAWAAIVAANVEPTLAKLRERSAALLLQGRAQWDTSLKLLQVKLAPLTSHMTTWMQQMATCFCAPFGGAIAYKDMASSEYPASVEAPNARA